jgi:hypothetical protein
MLEFPERPGQRERSKSALALRLQKPGRQSYFSAAKQPASVKKRQKGRYDDEAKMSREAKGFECWPPSFEHEADLPRIILASSASPY